MIDYKIANFFGIKNSVVLITGAAGQLGSELISAFLSNESKVVALDTNLDLLKSVAEKRRWPSEKMKLLAGDISKENEVQRAFEEAKKSFGEIDILVNNAGASVFEPFLDRPEESLDWVMDVNVKGTFFCIREFLRQTSLPHQKKCIVNIASLYGLISPDPRLYTDCDRKSSEIYGATKAGIIQMTKYFAVHAVPFHVRVNSVSPGGIRNVTNPQGEDFQKQYGLRCPMGRMAEVHEIVGAVLFLCSPAASYINGHNFVVDGGMSAW